MLWDSLLGNNPNSLEFGINIYAGGTFPTPGPLITSVAFPSLVDSSLNEFRHLDPPSNSVPLSVPLNANQTVVVSVEFAQQSSGNALASGVEHDGDGCQVGLNSVFTIPGGWSGGCAQALPGDFAIRAIIQPIPEPNALALLICGLLATLIWRGHRNP